MVLRCPCRVTNQQGKQKKDKKQKGSPANGNNNNRRRRAAKGPDESTSSLEEIRAGRIQKVRHARRGHGMSTTGVSFDTFMSVHVMLPIYRVRVRETGEATQNLNHLEGAEVCVERKPFETPQILTANSHVSQASDLRAAGMNPYAYR